MLTTILTALISLVTSSSHYRYKVAFVKKTQILDFPLKQCPQGIQMDVLLVVWHMTPDLVTNIFSRPSVRNRTSPGFPVIKFFEL